MEVYREMFGSEPQVVAIHAGLSGAFWATSCPGWIAFPMVPDAGTFTRREKLNIASTARMWRCLLEILKRL